jgi:hypothetical protein
MQIYRNNIQKFKEIEAKIIENPNANRSTLDSGAGRGGVGWGMLSPLCP